MTEYSIQILEDWGVVILIKLNINNEYNYTCISLRSKIII